MRAIQSPTAYLATPETTRPAPGSAFSPKLHTLLLLAALAIGPGLGGCVYRQTISQGNILKQEDIDSLKPGMSKKQVSLILGTPAVQSAFDQERWDYIYSYDDKKAPVQRKSVTLRFEDGVLLSIDGDFKPGGDTTVYKPEDVIIEATREYRKAQRDAEDERKRAEAQGNKILPASTEPQSEN